MVTATIKPILRWQRDQICKELLLLQGHISDPTCPCKTEGEKCVRKHLLTIEALAQETIPIETSDTRAEELAQLGTEAQELREEEEKSLCGEKPHYKWPIDTWARNWRKKFETLACELKQGKADLKQDGWHRLAKAILGPKPKAKMCSVGVSGCAGVLARHVDVFIEIERLRQAVKSMHEDAPGRLRDMFDFLPQTILRTLIVIDDNSDVGAALRRFRQQGLKIIDEARDEMMRQKTKKIAVYMPSYRPNLEKVVDDLETFLLHNAAEATGDCACGTPQQHFHGMQDKATLLKGRGKALLPAEAISDFRPGTDKVVRRGDRCFVVDTDGLWADVEIQSDVLKPEYEANIDKLSPEQRRRMIEAVVRSPYLSDEGRFERLAALKAFRFEVVGMEQPRGMTKAQWQEAVKNQLPMFTEDLSVAVQPPIGQVAPSKVADAPAPTPPPVPAKKFELFPFQKEGVEWLRNKSRALLADEMGLGKTPQAIHWGADRLPALVVVPAALLWNWHREITTMWRTGDTAVVLEGKTTIPRPLPDWTILTYGMLDHYMKQLRQAGFKCVIIDEAHMVKNLDAQRTKNLLDLVEPLQPAEFDRPIPNRLAVTGTPILNRPIELFALLVFLGVKHRNEFQDFLKQYTEHKYVRNRLVFTGARNLHQLHQSLQDIMLRRLKKDVLKNLPPKIHTPMFVPISNAAEYARAERDFLSWLRSNAGDAAAQSAARAETITRMNALRQLAAIGKVAPVCDWLKPCYQGTGKVIIFSSFTEPLELLEQCSGDAVIYDGSVPKATRQEYVDKFQKAIEPCHFLGTIGAAGVGITLTAASRVCFLDLPWTPGAKLQAEDRAHRIGQTKTVEIVNVLARGTIDERMLKLLADKEFIIAQAVDGKRQDEARTTSISNALLDDFMRHPVLAGLQQYDPESKDNPMEVVTDDDLRILQGDMRHEARMCQQPAVTISGKCNGKESCTLKVKASESVEAVSSIGGLSKSIEEVLKKIEATHAPPPSAITFAIGSTTLTRYEFQNKLVEAADLLASHDPITFEPTPNYPPELQPRLRGRQANRAQVMNIAKNLDPDALLSDFHSIDRGAPIVGPDNVVESGNGRIMAIQLAVAQFPEAYARYRDELIARASVSGVSPEEAQTMKAPVLVRVRLTDVPRRQFVEEANASTTLAPSAIEVARADASHLTLEMVQQLWVGEDQGIEDALRSLANGQFVSAFLATIPANQRAQITDAKGQLNQDGIRRMVMALFVNAFPGDSGLKLAEKFFESTEPSVRNVFNGIAQALGKLAKSEAMCRNNDRDPALMVGEDIAAAVSTFAEIKKTPGMTVANYLAQAQMFERRLNPFQERLLKLIDERARSGKKIGLLLKSYAAVVIESNPPAQGALIAGVSLTKDQALDAAITRTQAEPELAPAMFQPSPSGLLPFVLETLVRGTAVRAMLGGTSAEIAQRLRTSADALDSQIEHQLHPAIADQRPTGRRARIAHGMYEEGVRLQKIQRALRALADGQQAGTLPQVLAKISNKAQVEDIVTLRYFPNLGINVHRLMDILKPTEYAHELHDDWQTVELAMRRSTSEHWVSLTEPEMEATLRLLAESEKRGNKDPWTRQDFARYKRLAAAGIKTDGDFQRVKAAIDELVAGKPIVKPKDVVQRELEAKLIGLRIPGFFTTPHALAHRMVEQADIRMGNTVLEPSAGSGNIADEIRAACPLCPLTVIEINPTLVDILKGKGYEPIASDFLTWKPAEGQLFDRIIMNPPFDHGQDMDHVHHAWFLLKPGGRLVAIMSPHYSFAGDAKSTRFREWLPGDASVEELPAGTFAHQATSTGAGARLLVIDKAEERAWMPKVGDKVEYQGEVWEVGFINNASTGWSGTLRLQKSGDAGARQVNQVDPRDVKPATEEPWRETLAAFTKRRSTGPFALDVFEATLIHGQEVELAVSQGKPVPTEVLKDYPGLSPARHPVAADPGPMVQGRLFQKKPKVSSTTYCSAISTAADTLRKAANALSTYRTNLTKAEKKLETAGNICRGQSAMFQEQAQMCRLPPKRLQVQPNEYWQGQKIDCPFVELVQHDQHSKWESASYWQRCTLTGNACIIEKPADPKYCPIRQQHEAAKGVGVGDRVEGKTYRLFNKALNQWRDITAETPAIALDQLGWKPEDVSISKVWKSSGKVGTSGQIGIGWSKLELGTAAPTKGEKQMAKKKDETPVIKITGKCGDTADSCTFRVKRQEKAIKCQGVSEALAAIEKLSQ